MDARDQPALPCEKGICVNTQDDPFKNSAPPWKKSRHCAEFDFRPPGVIKHS
jgi:hypothetical protein